MARTIAEIYDRIIKEKESGNLTGLDPSPENAEKLKNDIQSTSKVAIWRQIFWIYAVIIHFHEKVFDDIIQNAKEIRDNTPSNTLRWFRLKALEYQKGNSLQFVDNKYKYTDDSGDEIIKRASVVPEAGQIRIKVAKEDSNGDPIKLTGSEKSGFKGYMDKLKYAGADINVISDEADEMTIEMDIHVNASIIGTDGKDANGDKPAEQAIDGYISELPFDGTWVLNEMIDKLQATDGVVDAVPIKIQARQAGGNYSDVFNVKDGNVKAQDYRAFAGYITRKTTTINYIEA